MWQLRQRWQRQQSDEVRKTEQVRLESFRVRRLLTILATLVMATLAGLAGDRYIDPRSATATAVSALGGVALALLLTVIPSQAWRVLTRTKIALGLIRKRRRLRALALAERAAIAPDPGQEPLTVAAAGDLAVACYLLGAVETAEAHLARALELDPEASCQLSNFGVVLATQGHHDRAAEMFIRSARQGRPEAALNSALVAPLISSEALVAEMTASETGPNGLVLNNIGVACAREGDWATAATWFTRAIEAAPGLPAARANLGLVAYRADQLQEAADQIMLANREAPNDPDFACYLGVILAAAGQVDQARFYLRRAHRVNPASVAVRINMSAAEALGGHWHVAEKGFRSLLGVDNHLVDIQYNMAVCDLACQDPTAAAVTAAAAIAAGDKSAEAYTLLAVALWESGRRAEALSHFISASTAPGADAVAASNLGRAFLFEGHSDRALKVLEQARRQWPEDPHLEFDQAVAVLASGASLFRENLPVAERERLLTSIHRCYGGLEASARQEGVANAEASVNLGLYLYMQEQYETAAEHFMEAYRAEPRFREIQFLIGTALGREGEKQTLRTETGEIAPTAAGRQFLRRAVPYLEAASEAREVCVPAAYNLARCLYTLEEFERGLAAVRKALRQENDGELNTLAALCAARQAQKLRMVYKTQVLSDSKRDQVRARVIELLNVSIHYFRQALLRDELDPTLHGNLGIAYMLRNREQDVEAALRHWERMRAIGGGAMERRYAQLSQMEVLGDTTRIGFDDRNAKLRGIDTERWLTIAPPRPCGVRFIVDPVAVHLPWRLVTDSPRLKTALELRDRIAQDEVRRARLRV